MTNVISFPVKPSPEEEAMQRILEYAPDKVLFILMDDERGVSFIAPEQTNYSEMMWAMELVKAMMITEAFED